MTQTFSIVPASAAASWIMGSLAVLMIGIAVLFGYIAYSSRNVRFEITPSDLTIVGDLYGRTIPRLALRVDRATVVDLKTTSGLAPRRKSNGTNLPGYFAGWFRLRNGEKALVFLTDRRRAVHIPTGEDYALLVSVTDPDGFLRALRGTPR